MPRPATRPVAFLLLVLPILAAGCQGKQASPSAASTPPSSSGPSQSSAPSTSPAAPSTTSSPAGTPASARSPVPVESNPPGDIPDNVAYVPYRSAAGRYTFVHPEGWATVARGTTVRFSDKLNGISASAGAVSGPPSVATAHTEVGVLRTSEPAFELRSIAPARLPGGTGVLIVFRRNSAPDAVTGKV